MLNETQEMPIIEYQTEELEATPWIETWWANAKADSRDFMRVFKQDTLPTTHAELHSLLGQVLADHERVRRAYFPPYARDARFYLLTAMSDVMAAIASTIAGEPRRGMAYLKSAHLEIHFLKEELQRLGVQV